MKIKALPTVHDRLIDESTHPGLTLGRVYYVIGISNEYFRVVNDNGEPILYAKALFAVVDPHICAGWVTRRYDDDEYYIDPPEFTEPGFYEDYFDRVQSAVDKFNDFVSRNSNLMR